jgi:hypothetical protein
MTTRTTRAKRVNRNEGPNMNQTDKSSAVESALSIIRTVVDVRGDDLPRPVLVRFTWFCLGAVFVFVSVRPKHSEA